ncbi:MAG: ABC transporter substrate-binding protein [Actinomycetota bacterium]
MRIGTKRLAVVSVLAIITAACAQAREGDTGGGQVATGEVPRGGILRLEMTTDVCNAFDPQRAYCSINWEYQRAMQRMLINFNGMEAPDGTDPQPDLAEALPESSQDGLTWTFKIKRGIHYGPPLENVEITAQDFIRTMERLSDPDINAPGYPFYYSPIVGFDEFGKGKADSIEGLSAPDDHTFVVEFEQPLGDVAFRFSMPATSPIPPNPDDPNARLGIAEGHSRDYGRFQVATGPYMFEGADQLDFSLPPEDQKPVSGYEPDRSIVLVRNPVWEQEKSTDPLRHAYLDGIETTVGSTTAEIARKVDNAETDIGFDASFTPEQVQRYSTDPDLQSQLHQDPSASVAYMTLNLAVPPLDDVHVRKAMNWAVDREAIRRVSGGAVLGRIFDHIIPDLLTGGLAEGYSPYATPGDAGDIDKAMEEMKLSKYDTDKDGVCDHESCEAILTVSDSADPVPKRMSVIEDNLEPLGLNLDIKAFTNATMYAKCEAPEEQVAICGAPSWAQDYPDASTFAEPLFSNVSTSNYGLVGFTPEQLKKAGYQVTEVPSVQEDIERCAVAAGDERLRCYVDFDKKLSEEVVPWVALRIADDVYITSSRVTNYHLDAFSDLPSLTELAVTD